MISAFWDVSLVPKTNYFDFYLWSHPDTEQNQETTLFVNLKISEIGSFKFPEKTSAEQS